MTVKEPPSLPENIQTSFARLAQYSCLSNSAPENIFCPCHIYMGHPCTWRSIILSSGYNSFSVSKPLQIRTKFLSTFSWTYYFERHPHPSASYLHCLLAFSRSQPCSQPRKTFPLTKEALIQWIAFCHVWLIPFIIIILSLPWFIPSMMTPFPSQNKVLWRFLVHVLEKVSAPMILSSISNRCN